MSAWMSLSKSVHFVVADEVKRILDECRRRTPRSAPCIHLRSMYNIGYSIRPLLSALLAALETLSLFYRLHIPILLYCHKPRHHPTRAELPDWYL